MKEPKIRFKGFQGEWEETTLANVGKCFSGIGFPETEQGRKKGIPFYKVSDMNNIGNEKVLSNSNNYVTEEQVNKNGWKVCNDVPAIYFAKVGAAVLLNRKRLVLKPCLCDNNTMLYSFDKKVWDTYFCQSYFETIDLASLVQVGSLPSYNASMVGEVNVSLPDIDEQKALGAYFQHLDSFIQSTTKKIESLKQVKAASLQSMFPQEGETTPRVRFKGFEGEWSICPLKYFAKKSTEKNISMDYTITLTNSAEYGVINQRDFFDHDISNDDHINGYFVIHHDDFVYNPRVSTAAPVGPINRNLLGYSGVMSPLYLIFRVNGINKDFLSYYFKTTLWYNYMKLEGNTGARFDRLSIRDEQFFSMPICVPRDEKEQTVIASYFTNLDRQITLQSQRLEKLKQIKAACLDEMFV